MFSDEWILTAIETDNAYAQIREELINFCLPLAHFLGFDGVSDVGFVIGEDGHKVSFIADWYGNYQSEHHEGFTFPIEFLKKAPDEVVEYLKKVVDSDEIEYQI